jgi:Zinc-finger of C2H2 type
LNDSGGKCFVCDVVFTSHSHGSQHLVGQKHKKKVLNTAAYSSTAPEASPLSSHFPSSLAPQLFPVIPRALASSGSMSQPAGPNGEVYVMNGTKGYCYVCSLELTSIEHANSHLNGTKHRKKCGADNVSSMAHL